MRRPNVKVYPKDLVPGEIYMGYESKREDSIVSHYSQIEVMKDGTPLIFGKYPITEEVLYFTRPMTWDEQQEWNRKQTMELTPKDQVNLIGIHTDLYGIADARHEMYNGWIEVTWEEQLLRLRDEDFHIVGIADPAPPRAGMSMRHPVAVVIEYENGDRYWCHAEKSWFDDMRENSLERYRVLGGN